MHPHLPHRRVHHVGVQRIERQIDGSGRITAVEHLRPAPSAVVTAIDTARRIWSEHMPQRRHQHPIGVARIDQDRADVSCRVEPQVAPCRPAVIRAIDAIAGHDVVSCRHLARSGIEHPGVRRRDRERADRGTLFVLHQARPGPAGVIGLPDPAAGATEVEAVGRARHAGDHRGPAGTERPDEAPMQAPQRRRRHRSGVGRPVGPHTAMAPRGGDGPGQGPQRRHQRDRTRHHGTNPLQRTTDPTAIAPGRKVCTGAISMAR